MSERSKLSRLLSRLQEAEYPADRGSLADTFRDHVLTYADGETNLGEFVGNLDEQRFDTASDLHETIQTELPVEAVGELGQSKGDA